MVLESLANIGATVMGRNMFGGHPGGWSKDNPWNGWWGDDPPFHHPVFVVTNHPRAPLVLKGGNTFTFVTDGVEAAVAQAKRAAGGKDVSLGGGANVAQQCLRAGLVDEMEISLVPILLGAGERLFEGSAISTDWSWSHRGHAPGGASQVGEEVRRHAELSWLGADPGPEADPFAGRGNPAIRCVQPVVSG